MSPRLEIEVSVTPETEHNYENQGFDEQKVEKILENLKTDGTWGWCRPRVSAKFPGINHSDVIVGTAELVSGSYMSEEDFKRGSDYSHLEALAIDEIRFKLTKIKELFDEAVNIVPD